MGLHQSGLSTLSLHRFCQKSYQDSGRSYVCVTVCQIDNAINLVSISPSPPLYLSRRYFWTETIFCKKRKQYIESHLACACFPRFLVLGCDRTGAAVAYTQKSTGYHPTDHFVPSQVHHLWIGEHGAFQTDNLFCIFPNWKKTSQPTSL